MYNHEDKYRCDVIRSRDLNDERLLQYAGAIHEIAPIAMDKDTFRRSLSLRLFQTDDPNKTQKNFITEMGKMFPLYYEKNDFIHESEICHYLIKTRNVAGFYKNTCLNFMFPNGTQKKETINQRIQDGIRLKPFHFVLSVLKSIAEYGIRLTADQIAYYILSSKDVLRGRASIEEVKSTIIQDVEQGINRTLSLDTFGTQPNESPNMPYVRQHMDFQIEMLGKAGLIVGDENGFILNDDVDEILGTFADTLTQFDWNINSELENGAASENTISSWMKFYGEIHYGENLLGLTRDDLTVSPIVPGSFETEGNLLPPTNGFAFQSVSFGAPGTGKSYLLNESSKQFENQKNDRSDDFNLIKAAVADAISKSGKLTLLNSIGFRFADKLKNIAKKDFADICGYGKIDELYLGALAKGIADSINANEKQLQNTEYIKDLLTDESKRGENDLLKWANAVGFKFGDYLKSWTLESIRNTFELSDAQMWWVYRGAQASQVEPAEIETETRFVERVTFHPNYSYAQFVGTYKPIQDEEEPKNVVYSYIPGPFMRTYVRAKRAEQNETGEKFLLIIEEINRANVAAVFGDVFQLLDRKNGVSEYPIAASEDIKKYLQDQGIADCDELKIPSNMYIWATMNSADQGVFPMDTAFKRRWEFEYIGVDDNQQTVENFEIPMQEKKDDAGNLVKDAEGNVIHEWMNWNKLRTQINDKLTTCGKNEDKLLGPFFISMEKLQSVDGKNEANAVDFVKSFKSKVLMYLFEDVCKMRPGDLFNCDKMRYSEICKKFDTDGIGVFNF